MVNYKKGFGTVNTVLALTIIAVAVGALIGVNKIVKKADFVANDWQANANYNGSSPVAQQSQGADCTGGDTIDTASVAGYKIHIFTTEEVISQFSCDNDVEVEFLVVAGGGGGGYYGGGGAGGIVEGTLEITSGTNYDIKVGKGGEKYTPWQNNNNSESGEDSYIKDISTVLVLAKGGGGGGGNAKGYDGGSGGGSGNCHTCTSNPATSISGTGGISYGNRAGNATYGASYAGSGGGGAGQVGGNASGNSGGNGGSGKSFNITGSSVIYGAGGNGWGPAMGSTSNTPGTSNTGNGAKANGNDGNIGGSGIIIIRYQSS